jgi:iron complex outermembrane receptor protein
MWFIQINQYFFSLGDAMQHTSTFRLKLITALVAGVFGAPYLAFAENKAEALEAGTVEVISTTPLPSIGTTLDQVPANVQAASAKTIEEQNPLNLSEFLDSNLGSVTTNDTVANPNQPDVFYRGFDASPLLGTPQGISVFVDGVRVNEPFGDVVNWDIIPANAIANINLIPGSNPLFGLNTLGGALSVHTKSGAEFPGTSVTAYGGSWGRRAIEAETGGKNGNFDYYFAGNTFKENGWRDHSEGRVDQIFGKVGWQNEMTDLDLTMTLADSNFNGTQAVPRSLLDKPEVPYSFPDSIGNRLAFFNLKGSHFVSDEVLIAGNVYYRHNEISGFNSNVIGDIVTPQQAVNIKTSTDQDGYGGTAQLTLLGDLMSHKNQFTGGASIDSGRTDFSSDTQDAIVIGRQTVANPAGPDFVPTVRLNAKNDYYGLYATDTFSINDKLSATASGRYNLVKVKLDDQLGTALNGDHTFHRFNPAVGLNYNPSKTLGFYGAYNEGMRAPTPVELTCADPAAPCTLPNAFVADPSLKQVVSKTWEGGARGKLADGWSWNSAVYHTELTDDIQFITTGAGGTGFFQNVGTTRRQGLELGVNGKIERLSLAVNYGFVDATFQTPFDANSESNSSADAGGVIHIKRGDHIPGIPSQTLKVRVGYELTPAWDVGTNIVAASSQYARGDENNHDVNGKVPGYTVVHFDTHYRINQNWQLFAKVNNVFDITYSTFGVLGDNSLVGPGRTFDPDSNNWLAEQFRSPAAPRAGWIGLRFDFDKPRSGASREDSD